MVLQRNKPIRVFGTCALDDEITVTLNDQKVTAKSDKGSWLVTLNEEPACFRTEMTITSALTGETVTFHDVAIGEVWLAGGQSNMEFIMKYDFDYQKTKLLPDDNDLRYFNYPHSAFKGFLETDSCPEDGFWRKWTSEENRKHFSAVGTYMALILREKLRVPVGIVACNWGGTPATAWCAMEDIKTNPALKPVLDWHEEACEKTDWAKYIPASEIKAPDPTPQQLDFQDRFMMGEDMSEFFRNFDPSKMIQPDFAPFTPGPRSTVRPAGLYENMLTKIAPYAIRGAIWYQGEDDDARNWVDFYDQSMITLINGWRKLWGYDFPFFQIELAPFRGYGVTGARKYDLLRQKQHQAAAALKDVHDICILDAGEEFNIHPRHKKIVGERLGRSVMKHVYGDASLTAESPEACGIERSGDKITVHFSNCAGFLCFRENPRQQLKVKDGDNELPYECTVSEDSIILNGAFPQGKLTVEYCYSNWCPAVLFNSEGNPAYGFSCEV